MQTTFHYASLILYLAGLVISAIIAEESLAAITKDRRSPEDPVFIYLLGLVGGACGIILCLAMMVMSITSISTH